METAGWKRQDGYTIYIIKNLIYIKNQVKRKKKGGKKMIYITEDEMENGVWYIINPKDPKLMTKLN